MDIGCFFEIHKGLPREGPGTNAITRKAYSFLGELPESPVILDIGCGPGKQTIELARLSGGMVTAIDLYQPYLDDLSATAARKGVANVETKNCSMDDLPFPKKSFDVIWGEGSIYNMGFRKGIRYLRRFLKPGGWLAVSEITWLRRDIPKRCRKYWKSAYAEIDSAAEKTAQLERAGYAFVAAFALPPEAWWAEYYSHIERRIATLSEGALSDEMKAAIAAEREEMDIHRRYSDYYSYVFYIMRRSV